MVHDRAIQEYADAFGMDADDLLRVIAGDGSKRRVLDVGSGQEGLLVDVKGRGLENVSLVGFDRRPAGTSKQAAYAEFSHQPFVTGSMDLALAACTLGYYAESETDVHAHFRELNRVLAEKGRILMVLNPVTTMRAYGGDGTHPAVIESDRLALAAEQFLLIKPSKYGQQVPDGTFQVPLLRIIREEGFRVDAKRMARPGKGTGGLVCVELSKKPVQPNSTPLQAEHLLGK